MLKATYLCILNNMMHMKQFTWFVIAIVGVLGLCVYNGLKDNTKKGEEVNEGRIEANA
jgi:hypothetical protein